MEKNVIRLSVILLIIVALTSTVTIVMSNKDPDQIQTMPYVFSVKDRIGIVLDTDALYFGGAPSGTRLKRSLNISVQQAANVDVSTRGHGNVIANESSFYMQANTTKTVGFHIDIPSSLSEGTYDGEVVFLFYR